MNYAREAVERFKVEEPIKSLLKPRWHVIECPVWDGFDDSAMLTLMASVPNAIPPHDTVDIESAMRIENGLPLDRIYKIMRMMLHRMLEHEADESIHIDGRRAFDPHSAGARS